MTSTGFANQPREVLLALFRFVTVMSGTTMLQYQKALVALDVLASSIVMCEHVEYVEYIPRRLEILGQTINRFEFWLAQWIVCVCGEIEYIQSTDFPGLWCSTR